MSKPVKPTPSEFEILRCLWEHGPQTVRQVHDLLPDRELGYTRTLKLMQIMAEKDLVHRTEQGRAHLYEAAVKRKETERRLLDEVVDRVFQGSAARLVVSALSGRKTSKKELAEIRRMLDEFDGGRK